MILTRPGVILEINGCGIHRTGIVSFKKGEECEISLAFVPFAKAGDMVMVHAGIAVNIIENTHEDPKNIQ